MATVKKDTGAFSEKNTDLGKFSHGDFDVEYVPEEGTLWVTLKVKYEFQKGIPADRRAQFKRDLQAAVDRWDNSGVFLETKNPEALNPIIWIRFRMYESNDYHKLVDVEEKPKREWVGLDLNVSQRTMIPTLTHELGHVFGNYDEYKGEGVLGWLERRMYWHDNAYLKQLCTLMNEGTEFPVRYFDHFEKYVNKNFAKLGI